MLFTPAQILSKYDNSFYKIRAPINGHAGLIGEAMDIEDSRIELKYKEYINRYNIISPPT